MQRLEEKIEEAQFSADNALHESRFAKMLANKSLDIVEKHREELNELKDEIFELKQIIKNLKDGNKKEH